MKKLFVITGLVMILSFSATGCGAKKAENAKEIYKVSCSNCHGVDLEGKGQNPSLKGIGSKLTKEEIYKINKNGQGSMPGGLISAEQNEEVSQWLADMK